MKKVAQQRSTGGAGSGARRANRGKIANHGKSASPGTSCATNGTDLRQQWHYNYHRNYQRTKGAGGSEANVMLFQRPVPANVVPLHAPITVSLSMVKWHQNTVVTTAKGTEAWFAIRPAEFETGKVTKFDKEKAA